MEKIIVSYYENNAERLHKMVDNILIKLKFDVNNEDFYSLANEIFVDALNRYDGRQEFEKFLYFQLLNKFKTEMTRRNRYKRQADRFSISIDTPIGGDNFTISDLLADKKTVESEFFGENRETFSHEMQQYLKKLSVLQRKILELISIGFTPSEIIGELHINKKMYDDCYNAIHSYRNISILM